MSALTLALIAANGMLTALNLAVLVSAKRTYAKVRAESERLKIVGFMRCADMMVRLGRITPEEHRMALEQAALGKSMDA